MLLNQESNDTLLPGDTFFLRPWAIEDAEWYVKSRDELIFKWTTESRILTIAQTKAAIMDANDDPANHCFAIVESETNRLRGNIALVVNEQAKRTAEIMYWLAPEGRGYGLAVKSVKLLSKWAFSKLEMEHIIIKTHPDNIASQRVAERAGFRKKEMDTGNVDKKYLWYECWKAV